MSALTDRGDRHASPVAPAPRRFPCLAAGCSPRPAVWRWPGRSGCRAGLRAAEPVRAAAIYTVPVEQQWVSRIHRRRRGGGGAGRSRLRVLGERLEHRLSAGDAGVRRGRAQPDPRRGVRRRAGCARGVARLSRRRVPDGLEPAAGSGVPELFGVRQLHPGCELPDRHRRGRDDPDRPDRHGRRLSDPRGEPADERLHGRARRKCAPTSPSRSPSSAAGSIRPRPRRPRSA